MTDQPRPEGQFDVQRWLGRCMLRLQQYERLLKALLAGGWRAACRAKRAAKRKRAQGHEDPHATLSGADLEQMGRLALFGALSALRGLTQVLDFAEEFLVGV